MSAPASRSVVEPARVAARLRRAHGSGLLQVRAVTRHAVRVCVTRSAWLAGPGGAATGPGEDLLAAAAETLRGCGYRVRRSDDGLYQAGAFIPSLVVGYMDWEDAPHE